MIITISSLSDEGVAPAKPEIEQEHDPGLLNHAVSTGLRIASHVAAGAVGTAASVLGGAAVGGAIGAGIGGKLTTSFLMT